MGHSVVNVGDRRESDIGSHTSSQRHTENVQSVYKVGFPPRRKLVREFADTLKETFFADDPLRPFKDQPRRKRILLGFQQVFPILDWGRHYSLSKFKGDVISGLTIASLCIPQVYIMGKLSETKLKHVRADIR